MRLLTFILLCLTWASTQAQKCETYEGKTFNCIDKDSLKQGFWYEYKIQKILTTDSFNKKTNAVGYHNDKGEIWLPISQGFYKDNKRVGQWTFNVGTFLNDRYYLPYAHTQSITFSDTGYFFLIDTFWNFNAKISNDTNTVNGVVSFDKDKIEIRCKDKHCYCKDPFNKNKKRKFDYKNLNDILDELNLNYNRLKRKKIGS